MNGIETKNKIGHAFFSKDVNGLEGEGAKIAFLLSIDKVSLSNEQLSGILQILDRAVAETETLMR